MSVLTGTIQKRRGTASEWTSANPVLLSGEEGYETDTGFEKIGDGVTEWNDLPYKAVASQQTGLVSGGEITIGDYDSGGTNNDIRVAVASYYILGSGSFSSEQTDFNNIALSSEGTQRYIGFFGKSDGTIQKVEGTEGATAAYPATPANTAPIGYVLVSDGAIGDPIEPGDIEFSEIGGNASDNASLVAYVAAQMAAIGSSFDKSLYKLTAEITHTGTTSETLIATFLVPAGTINGSDIIRHRARLTNLIGSSNKTIRIYYNSSNDLGTATSVGLYTFTTLSQWFGRNWQVASNKSSAQSWGPLASAFNNADFLQAGLAPNTISVDFNNAV